MESSTYVTHCAVSNSVSGILQSHMANIYIQRTVSLGSTSLICMQSQSEIAEAIQMSAEL